MKKLLLILLTLFMLVACGGEKKEEEVEVIEEEVVEPIAYSEPILVLTTKDSGINAVEDLIGKHICVQTEFDKDEMYYAVGQLMFATNPGLEEKYNESLKVEENGEEVVEEELVLEGINESNFVYATSYPEIPLLLQDNKIDAWIVLESRNELISDYMVTYNPNDYKTVVEYKMPIYEEKTIDKNITESDLYTKPFAVMLTGIDERVDPKESKGYARNDVNILLVVNPSKKHILTVSFPRDSYVYSVTGGYSDKLTHLSFYYGPEDVKDSIGNYLDIEVPYYVSVSFSTFVDIINKMGGVYVDVPLDMTMDQDSFRDVSQPYSLEKGESKLLGEWALALARNRKYGVAGGDYGRIRNQTLIVNSMISKIAKYSFLLDWMGIEWYADYVTDNNFNEKELKALVELSKTFKNGYTIDNFFVDNIGATAENGAFIGLCTDSSIAIASEKAKLVLNETFNVDSPYFDQIMTGYVTGGAGSYDEGYIGEEYDLSEVFDIKKEEAISYTSPIKNPIISCEGCTVDHEGIDLMSDTSKDILSSADGIVEEVGEDETLGKYISIKHTDGSKTLYATLGEIGVSKDEEVKQGQVIGTMGISGASTGEHVHFVITDKDGAILTNTSKILGIQ